MKSWPNILFLSLSLTMTGCDALLHGSDEKLLTTVLEGTHVYIIVDNDFNAPRTSACIDRVATIPSQVLIDTRETAGGNYQRLKVQMDQVAAVKTVARIDPQTPELEFQGRIMDCFNDSLKPYVTWQGSEYQVLLGTLHIQQIEFVNEITNPAVSGEAHSYHVTFTIDPPSDTKTGEGSVPTITTTCLLVKDAVENAWGFAGCDLA